MSFLQWTNSWTLIFPLAVLLYYFFRKRYTPMTISSTLFWESFMNETKASPYFEKLQKNALLFLQLLALFLFVLLVMKPYSPATTATGQDIWLVVDTSASMETREGDTTWFETQKTRMRALVDSHEGATFTVVTTGDTPTFVVQNSTNASAVNAAITAIPLQYEAEQLKKTVEFVKAGLPKSGAHVYVLTDAAPRDLITFDQENVAWRVENRPTELGNIAIKQFGVSQLEDETNAIVEIQNDTKEVATGTLEFLDLDGQSLGTTEYEVPANERQIVSAKLPATGSFYEAVLSSEDAFEADNRMTATLYRPVLKVAVDDQIHPTIQKALTAIGADVVTVPTDDLALRPEGELLITSNEELLDDTAHPILLVGRGENEQLEAAGVIEQKKPFSNYVDLSDVYVQAVYEPFPEATTIAAIGEQPFIQQFENGNLAVLASIDQTDWPLHPSYPLFLWAAMEQFSEDAETTGSYFPNDRVTLASQYGEWSIYDRDGEFISDVASDSTMTAPPAPGFYQLTDGDASKHFTVMLEQQEKQLGFEKSYEIGTYEAEGTAEVDRSLVPIGAVLLLLVLLTEWEVQRRRGFTT